MSELTSIYNELVDQVIRQTAGDLHDDHNHHHQYHQHDETHELFSDIDLKNIDNNNNNNNNSNTPTDLVVAKVTAMIVLFLAALFAGLIPFKLAQWFRWTTPIGGGNGGGLGNKKANLIVSLLLAFGGGVLLCTTFLHLLPEVNENVRHLQSIGHLPEFKFHFAELLMCLGFFTMYFIEQLVHAYLHHHHNRHSDKRRRSAETESTFRRGVSIRESAAAVVLTRRKKISEMRNGSISIAELLSNDVENNKYLSPQVEIIPAGVVPQTTIPTITDTITQKNENNSTITISNNNNNNTEQDNHNHHHHHHQHNHHSHLHLPTMNNNNNNNKTSDNDDIDDDLIVSSLRGLLIVLALSVHELFEGLAVGLEGSATNVWYLFSAVAAHKLVLAFCVGVELIVAKTYRWLAFLYVLTFSIVSPIGIGIGILVSQSVTENVSSSSLTGNESSAALVSVLLQGLASGTLLYVVFFEILQKDKSGLVQFVAVIIGFGLMFGLQFITGHEHSHGASGGEHSHSHADHSHHSHHAAGGAMGGGILGNIDITSTTTGTVGTTTENLIGSDHKHHNHNDHHDQSISQVADQLNILKQATDEFTSAITRSLNKEN